MPDGCCGPGLSRRWPTTHACTRALRAETESIRRGRDGGEGGGHERAAHADERTRGRAGAGQRTGVPAHRRAAIALRPLLLCAVYASSYVCPSAAQQCPDGTPAPCGPADRRPGAPPRRRCCPSPTSRGILRTRTSPGAGSEISNSLNGVPRLDVRSPALKAPIRRCGTRPAGRRPTPRRAFLKRIRN